MDNKWTFCKHADMLISAVSLGRAWLRRLLRIQQIRSRLRFTESCIRRCTA